MSEKNTYVLGTVQPHARSLESWSCTLGLAWLRSRYCVKRAGSERLGFRRCPFKADSESLLQKERTYRTKCTEWRRSNPGR